MLTRARHRQAIDSAWCELSQFERAWQEEKLPATVASVHLRAAVGALEELIGTVDVEDVFDRVFSSFCVGK
jgi:tRNA modification GTPase